MSLADIKVIRKALGDYTFEKIKDLKIAEWDSYRLQVTPWEIEQYLEKY